MKKTLLILFIAINSINNYAQATFQEDLLVSDQHLMDLNTLELQDGTDNYVVAGSLLDASGETVLTLTRIDNITGNVVWHKVYNDAALRNFRGFDIIRYNDGNETIAVTGSVTVNIAGGLSSNATYVAKIDASTGNFIAGKFYQIPGNFQNSQGLHIIYTEQMINMMPMPGFVIGGFINNAYTVSTLGNNMGFVLRLDINLNQLWLNLLDGNTNLSNDFDFVNNITEVNGGYFITGSTSSLVSSLPNERGGVLAIKLDNLGTLQWDSSYVFGNSYDVGADAYYDQLTEEIYLLTNYSVSHHFGVTVIDNLTGNIDLTKSWYAMSAELNKYGFTINDTFNPNHLVISGYIRDENLINDAGVLTAVQSTPFVYVFEKTTGSQILSYMYEVPYVNPVAINGFFYFWDGQMPYTYYPDISLTSLPNDTYFNVAYRTRVTGFSEMELINASLVDFLNDCHYSELEINPNPLAILPSFTNVIMSSAVQNPFNFTVNIQDHLIESCDPTASIEDGSLDNLNIYPNPAKDNIYITLEQNNIKKYTIFNLLGKVVLTNKVQENIEHISVQSLQQGIYLLRVMDENNNSFTSKFIKK